MSERQDRAEMEMLLKQPAFLKFLARVIQNAGIYSAQTNGADSRHLLMEGRRDLGLTILRDAARGQPTDNAQAAFSLTLIQVLREEAQSTQQEDPRDRRNRTDD